MKTADQIANLESRLEFQDETIATLNDEIVAHHQRLAELEKSFGVVLESHLDLRVEFLRFLLSIEFAKKLAPKTVSRLLLSIISSQELMSCARCCLLD